MDLQGQTIGQLLVLDIADRRIESGRSRPFWLVECSCGNTFTKSQSTIMSAKRKNVNTTCKYCSSKKAASMNYKNSHGLRNHKLYAKYYDIKSRLKRDIAYKDRKMCIEWDNSVVAFYKWSIANGWKEGLEIDRIDNNGDYEPTNCRFVTKFLQNQNKGKYKSKQEHACIKNINGRFLVKVQVNKKRINKSFYDIDEAIKYRDSIKGDNYVNSITTKCNTKR